MSDMESRKEFEARAELAEANKHLLPKEKCGHGIYDCRFDCVGCLQFTVNELNLRLARETQANSTAEGANQRLREALRKVYDGLNRKTLSTAHMVDIIERAMALESSPSPTEVKTTG